METVSGRAKGIVGTLLRLQVGLAFGAFILIGLFDGANGVLVTSFQRQYGIDKGVVGLLFLAGSFGYILAGFSSGFLVEKLGQRRFLMLGAGALTSGAVVMTFKPPFALVVLTFLLLGFGIATLDAGLNAYIAALPRSTVLLNNLHAFYGIGALGGPLIASTLLDLKWDWITVYMIWAALSLLVLVSLGLIYRSSAAHTEVDRENGPQGNILGSVLRLPVVWLAALFLLVYVGAEVSIGVWSYSFLTEERKVPGLLAGWTVSGYWLGLTLGRLVLARFAERLKLSNRALIEGCLAGFGVGVLLVWLVPVDAVGAFGLWLAGFALGPIFPTTIALVPNMVSPRLVQGAIGFIASVGSMGAAIFPWIAGVLAQGLGLWIILPYVLVLAVVMLAVWVILQARNLKPRERETYAQPATE